MTDRVLAAGPPGGDDETDLTPGIIRALRLLGSEAADLIAQIPDESRRAVYGRFFHERVCRQSVYSYTSGRFVFLQILARRGARPGSGTAPAV